jgi:hypothetical protein
MAPIGNAKRGVPRMELTSNLAPLPAAWWTWWSSLRVWNWIQTDQTNTAHNHPVSNRYHSHKDRISIFPSSECSVQESKTDRRRPDCASNFARTGASEAITANS